MIDEVAPERGPVETGPGTGGGARRRGRPYARSGSVAVALAVAALLGLGLAFLGFARWAGEHPGWAVLLGLAAVPVLYALVRGMPRSRELRRAARAGMAEAEAEAALAARAQPAPAPAEAAEPTVDAPFHDGRTVALPPPAAPGEAPGLDLATLDFAALDADSFEEAVAALCRRDGCADAETVGGAGDLGADILATAPDGRRVVVQCKRYGPENKVGSQDLQRFGGTCWSVHGAQLAVLVTTSEFTAPAEEYAESCGIRCVDGAGLTAWAEGSGPAPWGPGATVG